MKVNEIRKLSPVVERHYHIMTLLEIAADAVKRARELVPIVDSANPKEVTNTDNFLGQLYDTENDLWMFRDLVKTVVQKGGLKNVD